MSRLISRISMSFLAAVCAIPVIATMITALVALVVMPPICEFREGELGDYGACMSPYHTALAVSGFVLLIVVILLGGLAKRRGTLLTAGRITKAISPTASSMDNLQNVTALYQSGVITREEYERIRTKLKQQSP